MRARLLLIPLILFCANLQAATFDQSLYAQLHWRMIGPFRGGRVLAVTGVTGQPNHYYFGSVNGGVWETTDTGRTWNPIFDDIPIASIGAIAIAPSNPNVIYAGSGEADMRSDIGYGNGIYKSLNAGKTWSHIGLEDSHQIARILTDPKNPNLVFVAALGHGYGANQERGVFRSTDGGTTWRKILYKDADTGAIDLAFGADTNTIYAALWQTRRPPWNVYPPSKGPGSGLYKSIDGGNTWKQIMGHGFPDQELGRIGIAVSPSNTKIVYTLLDAKAGGLYRSDDAGENWKYVSSDKRIWKRGWYFCGVTVDPKNSDIVFASDTALYKSTDGGKTFQPFRGAPGGDDYHMLWIDPEDSNRMISGTDQGAIISVNGGLTWSSWYNQPTGQFYHMKTDNQFPYWVYGSQQDSGAAAIPSRVESPYDGINMTQFQEIRAGDENGYILPDPLNPQIIYGGTVSKLDRRTEQTTDIDPTFGYPDMYRSQLTLPLAFSPHNPHLLYFGNQFLFRTSDGGKHWIRMSGDLTREKLIVPPNLDPITANDTQAKGERRGVIYTIAPSPLSDRSIWIGTDDGLIWSTQDGGAHWLNVTPTALAAWSQVDIIEASRFNLNTAYAAIDRHRVDDYKPYIYRTHDGGKSWTLITNGIPDGHYVNVVREDPQKKGLLFAGTELGVYTSFDDGDQWQPLQMNLPVTSIRDIDVHGNDLVVATHGRAIWILDDITPLRELRTDVIQSQAWLVKPAIAYRVHSTGFTGTPLPKDEPMAENAPFGATIDFYIRNDAGKPVTLEILNGQNQVIRRYSSEDQPPKVNKSKIVVTPDRFASPQILSAKAGMHRFVWDLHHELPQLLKTEEFIDASEEMGPWALPGLYSIRLTVNGQTYSQLLEIKNDPRVKVPQTDLVRQFEFAKRIEAERVRIAAATVEIKQLLKHADSVAPKASRELGGKIAAFQMAVTNLTEISLIEFEIGTPDSYPTKATGLLYIGNSLRNLQRAVDGADASPSPDALEGFQKQRIQLQETLRQFEALKRQSLPGLNAALQQENLEPFAKE